eukprot:g7098.t1
MGNKPTLLAKQAIHRSAKDGLDKEIERILAKMSPHKSAAGLLEWEDDKGRTALIIAAANGHVKAVNLLLKFGANVQHMSKQIIEGGTALHKAVLGDSDLAMVDALLKYGSCPFVENLSMCTALDYALVKGDIALIRRLENYGYFANYMRVQFYHDDGYCVQWKTKWVVIVPRYGYPFRHGCKQNTQKIMKIYDAESSYAPICVINLSGAFIQQSRTMDGQRQVLVAIRRGHAAKPNELYSTQEMNGEYLLKILVSDQGSDHIEDFTRVINMQCSIPPPSMTVAKSTSRVSRDGRT